MGRLIGVRASGVHDPQDIDPVGSKAVEDHEGEPPNHGTADFHVAGNRWGTAWERPQSGEEFVQ